MKTKTVANYWSDESTGVPRGLAEKQWGGAARLLEAIRDGDVNQGDGGQRAEVLQLEADRGRQVGHV